MRVITPLGCVSCRAPLGMTIGPRGRNMLQGLGTVGSGAAIVGVLVFAAVALTIVGRGKKRR